MRALRLKILAILIGTVLLPAVPATLTVIVLFQRSLRAGAEEEIVRGARAGLAATRELLEQEKTRMRRAVLTGAPLDTVDTARLDARDRETLRALVETATSNDPGLLAGPERVELGGRQVLAARVQGTSGAPAWLVQPIPDALLGQAQDLSLAIRLVETLRRERETLTRGLVLTFVTVYGVVLLLVVLLGTLMASRLTRPLEALAGGIDRVAEGDLAARVTLGGEPGLARLIERFNAMAGQLEGQRAELVRLEKLAAWRNIARRLAHEVKNPLTPIRLAVTQMRDAWRGDDADYREVLNDGVEIVEEEIEKLRALTREFSEFARLPAPKPRPVAVRELLEETAALYGDARVRLTLAAEGDDLRAACDPEEIHRVLVNLVNNALEAQGSLHAGEPVEVVAMAADDRIAIEVCDRGPGVPVADRRRIFAPDVSTKSEGMGLGLAIVDEIVRAHGGTVDVRDRDGGGATFRFTLPRADGAA